MKRNKGGIFRQYFSIMILILLICFVLTGLALVILVSGLWMNEHFETLNENTNTIKQSATSTMSASYTDFTSRGTVIMVCNDLWQVSNATDSDYFIVNEQGEVVYCKELVHSSGMIDNSGECIVHTELTLPDSVLEKLRNGQNYEASGDLEGNLAKQHFIVAVPLTTGDTFRGAVVGIQPVAKGMLPYVLSIFLMFLLAFFVSFIIAFALIYIITYKTVKPLRQMNMAVKQYANGDFSNRINIRRKGKFGHYNEIDELAQAFNSMAQALSGLEMSRRSFVSNVSHELKTPMTTISGFIDGILDGTIAENDQKKYLKVVSEEVKRLSRLVTSMLNMSKIEEGKMDIKPTDFDLSEMIFRTLLNFEQIIEEKQIEIKGLENMEKNNVFADKDMINQVVYNLVDNAVKFTPEGGYIEVDSKRDSEKAIFKIRNSGKGIESDEIDKIFERFYKIDKSRSYDVKGAGLGLYLVKAIVEMHGGQIEAHSKVDEYTEFVMHLPLQ